MNFTSCFITFCLQPFTLYFLFYFIIFLHTLPFALIQLKHWLSAAFFPPWSSFFTRSLSCEHEGWRAEADMCHRWLLECLYFFRELLLSAVLPCPLCPRVPAFGSISERFFSSLVSGLVLALWHRCCRCWGTWTLFISSVSQKVITCEEERGIQWAQPSVLFTFFINEWIATTTPWRARPSFNRT